MPHSQDKAGGYLGVNQPYRKPTVKDSWKAETTLSESHLAFLNKQQAVPFRICRPIYDLLQKVLRQPLAGRSIGSFKGSPTIDEVVTLNYPQHLKDKKSRMERRQKFDSDLDQATWDLIEDIRKGQFAEYFRLEKEAAQTMSFETMEAAKLSLDEEQLWIVVESDFRGRFYCASGPLSYQGRDFQKGPSSSLNLWRLMTAPSTG